MFNGKKLVCHSFLSAVDLVVVVVVNLVDLVVVVNVVDRAFVVICV